MKPIEIDFSKGFDNKEMDKLLDNLPMMDEVTKQAIKAQNYMLEEIDKIFKKAK